MRPRPGGFTYLSLLKWVALLEMVQSHRILGISKRDVQRKTQSSMLG